MNVRDYWKQLRRSAAKLDPDAAAADAEETDPADKTHLDKSAKEIWLISVENHSKGSHGGRVVSAHPITAARWIDDATHVLATPQQVSAHQADLALRKEQIDREESERRGVPTHKLLEAMIAGQQMARNTAPSPRTTTKGDQ
ncbi:MAG: hypothetical protein NVS9B4_00780 [Candidatus Acidiferrum sp.]